jgi:hypothetical protein
VLAFDICDICDVAWGAARLSEPPGVWTGHDWVLINRRSVPEPTRYRREMTTFVRTGELWRRDDETHDNVLVDTESIPKLLARCGVEAEIKLAFGDETLDRTRRRRREATAPIGVGTRSASSHSPNPDLSRPPPNAGTVRHIGHHFPGGPSAVCFESAVSAKLAHAWDPKRLRSGSTTTVGPSRASGVCVMLSSTGTAWALWSPPPTSKRK